MSRIIVKQLPKSITEEKLRNIFGSKGTITDLQLKYTPDGKFRQFCFIGYRSESEAQEAIKFFHNSCIQTSRIKVELCAALGAEDKPQSWSKYAKDNKKALDELQKLEDEKEKEKTKKKGAKVSKIEEIIGAHKDDPDFVEFMKAHDKKRTLWANDADMEVGEKGEEAEENEKSDDDINAKGEGEGEERGAIESGEEGEDSGDLDDSQEMEENEGENVKLAEKPISDMDYMKSLMGNNEQKNEASAGKVGKSKTHAENVDLFTIKIHNVPYKIKRQEILKFFKPLKPYSVRLPAKVHGFCYVGFKTEKDMTKAMLKDKSFIKGKQVFFSDFTEKNKITKSKIPIGSGNDASSKASTGNPKWSRQEESTRNEEDISESGRIFFRNLAYTVTEDDLQGLFEKFGPIAEIHLPIDGSTRQIKGFGTVTFVMPEHAVQAFNKLDGTDFHGRLLHLIPAKSADNDQQELDENDAGLSFKQKKALKLKKTAQQSISWNTLFLGANAVAEILARKLETSKEKILDTSEGGSSAAVRLALGETEVVIEMKKFLEEHGVRLSAFDATTSKRSKTVIIAKNLPADTTVADLTPIFGKFGPIGRIVLPPSGVTALIEFCDPSEAKQAFKKLAYSKFKNMPLFLEWAPENLFTTTVSGEPIVVKQEEPALTEGPIKDEVGEKKHSKGKISTENIEVDPKLTKENVDNADNDVDDLSDEPPEPNTTLFLRNLNFKTVKETVFNHFKHLGPIHTVEVAKRKDPEDTRRQISLGYGFIQFKKSETASQVLKNMQFTTIDGNQVELKRSDRTLKTPHNGPQRKKVKMTKQTGSKILVRNIPFQANAKEVRDIFKAFGEIRSLRLPMKMSPGESSHRGFGFVDFITKSEAKRAFEALSQSTHLYGRRLVLEWASTDDENVEEIRKRTTSHFQSNFDAAKRSKKSVFNADGGLVADSVEDEKELN